MAPPEKHTRIQTLSPKQLADAIGVSESSIKRWVDRGTIRVVRTVGGHRRIAVADALRFTRARGIRIRRPEVLGVSADEAAARPGKNLTPDALFDMLQIGDVVEAGGAILADFSMGGSAARLFDRVIAPALARFGTDGSAKEDSIYLEHRATAAVIEAIDQIKLTLPQPLGDAPLAVGGAPEKDPHAIPSLMASVVCLEAGLRSVNLGPDTPRAAFAEAIDRLSPSLVWLAVKSPLTKSGAAEVIETIRIGAESGATVVVGGHEANARSDMWPADVVTLDSMEALLTVARGRLSER